MAVTLRCWLQVPRNPTRALSPAPSDPLVLTVAFQHWVTVRPLASCQVTVHEEPAVLPGVLF